MKFGNKKSPTEQSPYVNSFAFYAQILGLQNSWQWTNKYTKQLHKNLDYASRETCVKVKLMALTELD